MLIKLTGGKVIDPAHKVDGVSRDIYIRDGHIVDAPEPGTKSTTNTTCAASW